MSDEKECLYCVHRALTPYEEPCEARIMSGTRAGFTPKQKEEINMLCATPEQLEQRLPNSATEATAKIMGYSHPLYEAFDDAVQQATKGKGVRHGGEATPFLTQPIFQIAKHTGVGGLIFQMVKKAQEACGKDDQEAFERELLGALVYGGAAYVYVKQHGFKKVAK